MPDFKDKIPSVRELVDNGKKAAETYERNPTGSFVWIILVLSIGTSIFFGAMYFRAQEKLNEMAETAFNQAMNIKKQETVIEVQKDAIQQATDYVQDSVEAVNVRNFKGKLKINKR